MGVNSNWVYTWYLVSSTVKQKSAKNLNTKLLEKVPSKKIGREQNFEKNRKQFFERNEPKNLKKTLFVSSSRYFAPSPLIFFLYGLFRSVSLWPFKNCDFVLSRPFFLSCATDFVDDFFFSRWDSGIFLWPHTDPKWNRYNNYYQYSYKVLCHMYRRHY